jgi:hypothetical protein
MTPVLPAIVYILCVVTSGACAWLLLRNFQRTNARLLLWSGISFLFLAANNTILFVDLVVLPEFNLSFARTLLLFSAVVVLLFGLVWDLRE